MDETDPTHWRNVQTPWAKTFWQIKLERVSRQRNFANTENEAESVQDKKRTGRLDKTGSVGGKPESFAPFEFFPQDVDPLMVVLRSCGLQMNV